MRRGGPCQPQAFRPVVLYSSRRHKVCLWQICHEQESHDAACPNDRSGSKPAREQGDRLGREVAFWAAGFRIFRAAPLTGMFRQHSVEPVVPRQVAPATQGTAGAPTELLAKLIQQTDMSLESLCASRNGCYWLLHWFSMIRPESIQISPEILRLTATNDEFKAFGARRHACARLLIGPAPCRRHREHRRIHPD